MPEQLPKLGSCGNACPIGCCGIPQSGLGAAKGSFYRAVAVDDSRDDLFLLERAFRSTTRLRLIFTFECGSEFRRFFRGEGAYADRDRFPLPDLLLLDIKMPAMSGFDVLEWMQKENSKERPIVVMLSASPDSSDVERAMSLGADYYQCKPCDHKSMDRLITMLEGFIVLRHDR